MISTHPPYSVSIFFCKTLCLNNYSIPFDFRFLKITKLVFKVIVHYGLWEKNTQLWPLNCIFVYELSTMKASTDFYTCLWTKSVDITVFFFPADKMTAESYTTCTRKGQLIQGPNLPCHYARRIYSLVLCKIYVLSKWVSLPSWINFVINPTRQRFKKIEKYS